METFRLRLESLVYSRWFVNLSTGIILFYACVLGFRTFDELSTPLDYALFVLDWAVTLFFAVEVTLKMLAAPSLKTFFKDPWNSFDFVIVAVALIPLDNSQFAAAARILRVFRVLRLITVRPELRALIEVLLRAVPAIVDIVILMFIIFYIYAVVGSFLFDGLPSGLWDNFLTAMLTLFRILTFEDWTDVMYEAMERYPWSWAYFVSFVVITAFVLFNLFVAVIIGEMQKMQEKKAKAGEEEEEGSELAAIKAQLDRVEALLRKEQ